MTARRSVSREEVTAALGCSQRALEKMVQSEQVQSRAVPNVRARNGRTVRRYYVDSFPLAAGMKLLQQPQGELEASAGERRKIALTHEEEEELARGRYRVIEPLLNFSSTAAESAEPPLLLPDGREVRSATTMCEHLAIHHQLSQRTIYRWVQQFRRGGLSALADCARSEKGKSRFFERYDKAAVHAAYLYLVQRRSVRLAHEAIVRDREILEVPEEELPSYETVRAFVRSIPPAIETLARNGYRAYRERMAPYVSRAATSTCQPTRSG